MVVYMEPLWDELFSAWEVGVWTYDRAQRATFKMYVWHQYSIHDHYYRGDDRDFTHTAERVLMTFWVTLAPFFSLHHIRLTQS
jgi:hypothetical protein